MALAPPIDSTTKELHRGNLLSRKRRVVVNALSRVIRHVKIPKEERALSAIADNTDGKLACDSKTLMFNKIVRPCTHYISLVCIHAHAKLCIYDCMYHPCAGARMPIY